MKQISVASKDQMVSSFAAFTLSVLKFRTLFTACFQRKCELLGLEFTECLSE